MANFMVYYLDENGQPVGTDDFTEADAFLRKGIEARRVARTEISADISVSTVFLTVNHNWGDGPPILW